MSITEQVADVLDDGHGTPEDEMAAAEEAVAAVRAWLADPKRVEFVRAATRKSYSFVRRADGDVVADEALRAVRYLLDEPAP